MTKNNIYLPKENIPKTEEVREIDNKYEVPSFEEFMKTYEPNEEVEILTEVEYQDRLLHGSRLGPGNGQSHYNGRIYLDGRHHLALLSLGVDMLALRDTPRSSQSSSTPSSSTSFTVERKTIWDWWGNGLAGWQREYLLQIGYEDRSSTYSLYYLKQVTKYREKELLTELSKTYIQQWINENDYSSSEERDRRERVVNCSKKDSPVWRGKQHYRGKIKTNGKSGDERRYYKWDNTHNDIEVYNRRDDHLGSMDPRTGKMYKSPDPDNSIRDLL